MSKNNNSSPKHGKMAILGNPRISKNGNFCPFQFILELPNIFYADVQLDVYFYREKFEMGISQLQWKKVLECAKMQKCNFSLWGIPPYNECKIETLTYNFAS